MPSRRAAAAAGARVTLVSGPVDLPDPPGVAMVHVESARDMLAAVEAGTAGRYRDLRGRGRRLARRQCGSRRRSRRTAAASPDLALAENPDILATIAHRNAGRPELVVGFAAETENVVDNAKAKLARKGCDLIVANDVSPESGVMGGDRNTVHLVSAAGVETWPTLSKTEVAEKLMAHLARMIAAQP